MSLNNLNSPYNYLGLLNITNNNVDAINANDIQSNTIENSLTITTKNLVVTSSSIFHGITNTGNISNTGSISTTGEVSSNTISTNSILALTEISSPSYVGNNINVTGDITGGLTNTITGYNLVATHNITASALTTTNTLKVNSTSIMNGISNTGSISSTGLITSNGISNTGSISSTGLITSNGISNTGSINSTSLISNSLSSQSGTNTISLYPQFTSYQNYNFKKLSSISNSGYLESVYTENHPSYSGYAELSVSDGTGNYNINKQFYSNSYNFYSYASGKCVSSESYNGVSNLRMTINDLSGCIIPNLFTTNITSGTIYNNVYYPITGNAINLNASSNNKQKLLSVNDNALFNYYYTNATVNSAGVSNAAQLIISAGGGSDNFNATSVNYGYIHDFQVYASGYCISNDCNTGSKSRLNISNGTITITDLANNGFYNFNPSLTLNHTSTDGASTILFNSKNNVGSDFGCIMYQDNITGIGGELSRLMIAVQNDGIGVNQDHILLSGAGGVLINNDITTTNLPAYSLEVQGTMGLSSPQSYSYTSIPTYIKSQIGYIYQRTFSAFSATNLTQNTYNQIATSITSSDINTGTYMIDIRFNVSASSTQFVPFYFAITSTGTPNYQTNSGAIFNFQSYVNCPPNASIPYYTSACCSNTAVVDWNSYSNLYFWFSVAIPITQTFYLNGSSNATNSPNSKITMTRVA
jgi:hypothetical protein